MTSANIQIGAGDVTALLIQRQVEALEERLACLRQERERLWLVLDAAVLALDAQGEAKFAKLKPALDAIAAGYRLLYGRGKYTVHLRRLQDRDHATARAFHSALDTSYGRDDRPTRWVLLVSIERVAEGWTTENLLPPGHTEIEVKLDKVQSATVNEALTRIREIDQEADALREKLGDIPAIERKARASMTETLLASLEPDVLKQIEGCIPEARRIVQVNP